MISALEDALPPGSLAPFRYDHSAFDDSDHLESLSPEVRAQVVANPEDVRALGAYRAVAGHFFLPTLLSVMPASAICTVLREPRARLLSLYTFWRTFGSDDDSAPASHGVAANAMRPLREFLSNRELPMDNAVCRTLLPYDPRIPGAGFVAAPDVEAVAADAIEQLDAFGFVGILELGEATWDGVGRHFGVTLRPQKVNETGEVGSAASEGDAGQVFTDGVLELLTERTAADALVYDHALERAGVASRDERARITNQAFAAQLVRLGDLCGPSAAKAAEYAAKVEPLIESERALEEELARTRRSLEAVQSSASWRVTAPLRSAKRLIRRLRSKRAAAR